MRYSALAILPLLLSTGLAAQCPDLVWSDEFDGDTLNLNNWTHEIGDGCDRGICGWGNQELQSYQSDNTTVSDGTLKITARPEAVGNSSYTSSRIISKNKQDFTYGRMEARIKVPRGNGTWPAFWMLSTDEVYGTWPQSGEIDIMEYVGREPNQVLGTIHYGKPYPLNRYNTGQIDFAEPVYDEFHEFAVEWQADTIRWMVDDILFHTQTPDDLNGENWPFDQDFFFILNLAVGGTLGGPVDASAFPATLEVDYVRVYGSNRPYIAGERKVDSGATGVTYTIGNLAPEVAVNWTIPDGATIVSGQGTPSVIVDWGTSGGTVSAATVLACGEQTLSLDVAVTPAFSREFALENFDEEAPLTYTFSTGSLTEVPNPAPNAVNGSALSGLYVRSPDAQYDLLVYDATSLEDATAYSDGEKRFYVDVYTTAATGTQILLQLETASASDANYPTGRHSRYQATVREQNAWHRLEFEPLDRPDPNASGTDITQLILLFHPNAFVAETYYFDNLDSYAPESTGLFSPPQTDFPMVASPNPAGDRLTVRLKLERPAEVSAELFSVEGRRLGDFSFGDRSAGDQFLSLSLQGLSTGVYLLRVKADNARATLRIVRE